MTKKDGKVFSLGSWISGVGVEKDALGEKVKRRIEIPLYFINMQFNLILFL